VPTLPVAPSEYAVHIFHAQMFVQRIWLETVGLEDGLSDGKVPSHISNSIMSSAFTVSFISNDYV